jgi:hypothetical protein
MNGRASNSSHQPQLPQQELKRNKASCIKQHALAFLHPPRSVSLLFSLLPQVEGQNDTTTVPPPHHLTHPTITPQQHHTTAPTTTNNDNTTPQPQQQQQQQTTTTTTTTNDDNNNNCPRRSGPASETPPATPIHFSVDIYLYIVSRPILLMPGAIQYRSNV